jgi:hypothetical protein
MSTKQEKEQLIDEISMLLFTKVPSMHIPKICIDRMNQFGERYGGCGEVYLAAIKESLKEVLLDKKPDN